MLFRTVKTIIIMDLAVVASGDMNLTICHVF